MRVRRLERADSDGGLFPLLDFDGERGLGARQGGVEQDVELVT